MKHDRRDSDSKTDEALANKSNDEHSSGTNNAAIYAGLISNSGSESGCDEEGVDNKIIQHREEDFADDKDIDEDPDFMASDTPADEYLSVEKEKNMRKNSN